ncbi:hypothetical protein [Nocardia sp. NPDC046763]|uniref:hypothetical protein n=1 Tax=Nocardia sp. NPDC046763 TaxID=3155256 RepID=UPI0033C3E3B4
MESVFAIAIAITAAVALARLALWCDAPRTRPITVALSLLAIGAIFIEPQWHDGVDSFFVTRGLAGLVSDVVLLVAVCLLCAHVARVWDNEWLNRAALVIAVVGGLALVVVHAIAVHAGAQRGYTGQLSGPATVYGILLSVLLIAVNVAPLITVALARPVTRIQFWFAASALTWVVIAGLGGAAAVDPEHFADILWQLRLPLDTLALLTGSAVGLSNLWRRRRAGAAPVGWSART